MHVRWTYTHTAHLARKLQCWMYVFFLSSFVVLKEQKSKWAPHINKRLFINTDWQFCTTEYYIKISLVLIELQHNKRKKEKNTLVDHAYLFYVSTLRFIECSINICNVGIYMIDLVCNHC